MSYKTPSSSSTREGFIRLTRDLGNTSSSPYVTGLQGRDVSSFAPTDGYVLTWVNGDGYWAPRPTAVQFVAGGDLTGTATNQTVSYIRGVATPLAAPNANEVLFASNASTLTYGLLTNSNIDAAAAIAGTKISPNFGAQNVQTTGTLTSGAITAPSLDYAGALNIGTVNATGITFGKNGITTAVDGYFQVMDLTTGVAHFDASGNVSSSTIVNADVDAAAAIAGTKISPDFGAQNVVTTGSVTGATIGVGTGGSIPTIASGSGTPGSSPNNGSLYMRTDGTASTGLYTYQSGSWSAISATPTGSAGGDLSGTYPNPTVAKINGTSVDATPSANTVLVATSGTTSVWSQIVDGYVSASAAIAGTKISPNFGSQNVQTTGTLTSGAITAPSVDYAGALTVGNTSATSLTLGKSGITSTVPGTFQVSSLSTGIAHVDASGNFTSSAIVNADVDAAAAIAGTKISPNFGSQNVQTTGTLTSGAITAPSLDYAGTLNIGITDATSVVIGKLGATTTIAGNLTVNGTTTTVNSTTVDVADRIIHVNHSTGTIPVPSQITGWSVHRGNDGVSDRDHVGFFWDETNTTWKVAYNTGGDDVTLGSYLPVQLSTLASTRINLDGYLNTGGIAAPAVSASGRGVIYFDSTANRFRVSENGGSYSDLVVSGSVAGGDLDGYYPNPTVVKINGTSVNATPSANTVLVATSGTTSVWSKIVDGYVDAAAAIAGTKISPNFGSQNILTTGTLTSGAITAPSLDYAGALNIGPTNATSVVVSAGGTNTFTATSTKNDFKVGQRIKVSTQSASYTLTTSDYVVIVDSSGGAYTMTLPATPTTGDVYIIKDKTGDAGTNNITVQGSGGATIDGSASHILDIDYSGATFFYNGTEWNVI